MAGLYIHIPFCASRCIYCGFYSTTHQELRQRYVDALCLEMQQRDNHTDAVGTIYLGGGTPSQLEPSQLQQLFYYINKVYGLSEGQEITIECNPDDLTPAYVEALAQLPINRISMGVQTFCDERLRFLHRRHNAHQIPKAIDRLRQAGFCNISIDLMYGFPGETISQWHYDIDQALALNVEHISAYSLMIEEGMPLHQLITDDSQLIDEETERQMFFDLIDRLAHAGYEHYELSNFAKKPANTHRSRHNSSYWHAIPYIGLGAAAHSYNGFDRRRWNVSNLQQYLDGIESGKPLFDYEVLDADTRYNEQVMTALRTCEGLGIDRLSPRHRSYCLCQARRFITDGLLDYNGTALRLTRKGLFVSNMVMSELMIV